MAAKILRCSYNELQNNSSLLKQVSWDRDTIILITNYSKLDVFILPGNEVIIATDDQRLVTVTVTVTAWKKNYSKTFRAIRNGSFVSITLYGKKNLWLVDAEWYLKQRPELEAQLRRT